MMQLLKHEDLADFIEKVDASGGPSAPDFQERWGNIRYQPSITIDPALDPYGAGYLELMLAIYREISGRELDQAAHEMVAFDMAAHVSSVSPYGPMVPPADIALHFNRLSSAVRVANLPSGAAMLDMGCGWGLSTELLAQCGFVVSAVDINPAFVALVEARARRFGYPVTAIHSAFDDFRSKERFDGVLFYECLHHAVAPWRTIESLTHHLKDGGKFLLCGEPIQDDYWPHWGLRLDAMSVYCIRKYGWFESGWSLAFLRGMFARAGLLAHVKQDTEGMVVCASRPDAALTAADLLGFVDPAQWHIDADYLISKGEGSIEAPPPSWAAALELRIENCRGKPIAFRVETAQGTLFEADLSPGENHLTVPIPGGLAYIVLHGETWVPGVELGTNDPRTMSFHLSSVRFV